MLKRHFGIGVFWFLLVVLLTGEQSLGQQVFITVLDQKNREPVAFAHVCYEGLQSGSPKYYTTQYTPGRADKSIYKVEVINARQIELKAATNMTDLLKDHWKYYNFEAGSYTVEVGLNYVIKNRKGYFYKLRFVEFYNNLGQKGYPAIEYQQL